MSITLKSTSIWEQIRCSASATIIPFLFIASATEHLASFQQPASPRNLRASRI